MQAQSREKALELLNSVEYAIIATANKNGTPWNTPVFFAHDENNNLYWFSLADAVHSQNIIRSQQAFIVVLSTIKGSSLAVYMDCKVEMLDSSQDIKTGLNLLGKRRGEPFSNIDKFLAKDTQRIFKATPQQVWMNDSEKDADGDFVKDFRVEVIL